MIPAACIIGRSTLRAQLSDFLVDDEAAGGPTASVQYTVNPDGNVYNQDGAPLETWLLNGRAAQAEIMATATGAAPTGSPLNTWLPLTSPVGWGLFTTTSAKLCTLTVRIRKIGASTDLDTATISMSVSMSG